MTIDSLAARFSAHFRGVGASRASFVRIHVWALVFLLAASVLTPVESTHARSRGSFGPVDVVTRGENDQRAFYQSPFSKKKYFHIAWIMGSEGDVFSGRSINALAAYVQRSLPVIDHRPVVVDVYYFLGMLVGDDYLSLLDALAAKPDMVVLSLNALYVLNPRSVHQWTQLDARGAVEIATKPKAWPVGSALLSPEDLAWGVAQSHLKAIAERTYLSGRLHDHIDELGPLNRRSLAKATAELPVDGADIATAQDPFVFWFQKRAGRYPTTAVITRWMAEENREQHPLNSMILRAIATALKSSGVPSYVYLSQVNTTWLAQDPALSRALSGIERQLGGFRGAFDAANIRFQPKSASRLVPGLRFLAGDPIHISDPAGFGPYLARQLCQVEAQIGQAGTCRPTSGGAEHG